MCPFDTTGYAGSDTLGNPDTFSGINGAKTSGNVVFGGGGLAAGGTAWFSLEGNPQAILCAAPTPEPTSVLLVGSGLMWLVLTCIAHK